MEGSLSGIAYATGFAQKYAIKYYIKNKYKDKIIFNFKELNDLGNPLNIKEKYIKEFIGFKKIGKEIDKISIKNNLLDCIDIRLFGSTFCAKGETSVSIFGAVQIQYARNIWKENIINSIQIMSPFRNEDNAEQSTLGNKSTLQEGHYSHHFSINPENTEYSLCNNDITILKEAMRKGVTYYDSSSKAGCENELLIWVQLKEDSKLVLPNFTPFISCDKKDGKMEYDLNKLKIELDNYPDDIKSIEIYYNNQLTAIMNPPKNYTDIKL